MAKARELYVKAFILNNANNKRANQEKELMSKKINLKICLLFLIILNLSFVFAEQQSLGIIKQNDCVRLIQTYPSCTAITLSSVIYPNKAVSQTSILMSTSDSFEWIYNYCNTSVLGQYIVNGHGDVDGIDTSFAYDFFVTPTGEIINGMTTGTSIFFLLICLGLIFFSVWLIIKNPMTEDIMSNQQLYETKKHSEFLYLVNMVKQKMWIVGVFLLYISLLIFVGILNQLVYSLGLTDLNNMLTILSIIMGWGLIPFILFWMVYVIIVFYLKTKDIMAYELGNIVGGRK